MDLQNRDLGCWQGRNASVIWSVINRIDYLGTSQTCRAWFHLIMWWTETRMWRVLKQRREAQNVCKLSAVNFPPDYRCERIRPVITLPVRVRWIIPFSASFRENHWVVLKGMDAAPDCIRLKLSGHSNGTVHKLSYGNQRDFQDFGKDRAASGPVVSVMF